MAKGMYLGVDSKAHKVKKMYLGVDGKARKVKKVYIGDANGKARLCWSGASPQYLITTSQGKAHISTDAISWEQVSVPLSNKICLCAYGNGIYVMVFDPCVTANTASSLQVATSTDGRTWTLRTIGTVTPNGMNGYTLNFCNGIFIVTSVSYESGFKYHVYTSVNGITWQKKGNSSSFFQTFNNKPQTMDIVYGYYDNKLYYIKGRGSGIEYSTDLITWTQVSSLSSYDIRDLIVTSDGTAYAITAKNILRIQKSATSIWTTADDNYTHSNMVYDEEEDELYWLSGANSYATTSNYRRCYKTVNKRTSTSTLGFFYGSNMLQHYSFVKGNDKLSAISTNGSSSDKVMHHYSLDGGNTWTLTEIGTGGSTSINNNNSMILFTKGE